MNRDASHTFIALALALVALCASTACGKSGSIASPLSPSGSGSPAAAASGAVVSGQVSAGSAMSSGARRDTYTGVKVSIVGTDRSAIVDNLGRFRLDSVRSGDTELQFEGQGLNVRVSIGQVGENEKVEVHISLSSGNAVVDAAEHVRPDDGAALFGRVASIDSNGRSLQVGARLVQVPATADIQSRGDTVDFSALAVGQLVEIEGSLQGDVVSAQKIRIEDDPSAPGDGANRGGANGGNNVNEIEFIGSVTAVSGACPARAFVASGTNVTTSDSTSFERVTCGGLTVGALVQVKGVRQADGSVAASRVRLE